MNKIISNMVTHNKTNERVGITKNGNELNMLIKYEILGEVLHHDIIPLACLTDEEKALTAINSINKYSDISYCKIKLNDSNPIISVNIIIDNEQCNFSISYDTVDKWDNGILYIVPKHK